MQVELENVHTEVSATAQVVLAVQEDLKATKQSLEELRAEIANANLTKQLSLTKKISKSMNAD